MSNTDQAPEPSMEEILSSIRRIISDDGETPAAEEAEAPAAEEAPEPEASVEPEVEEAAAEEVAEPVMEMEAVEEAAEPSEAAESPEEDDDIFELTNVVEVEETPSQEAPAEDALDMAGFEVASLDNEADQGIADCGADIEDDIEFIDVETGEAEVMPLPEPGPEPVLEVEEADEGESADRLVSDGVGVAAGASFGDLANTLLSRGNSATTVEELVQEMLRPLLKGWLDANLPTMVEKLVGEEIERIARRGR